MASDEREGTPEDFAAMFGRRQPSEDDEPSTAPEPEPTPAADAEANAIRERMGANAYLAPLLAEGMERAKHASEWIARLHRPPEDDEAA